MARTSRSIFWTVFFLSLLVFAPFSWAETTPNVELERILRKIEERNYRWIAIRAEVLFFFAESGNSSAMCSGDLLYQRLDERMFLSCVNSLNELVFAFRTMDRRFDLYLPAQNTVYHGSIFDLEDSPDIESHLKARDLYRALKPLAVDPRKAKVERTNSAITNLDVYSQNGAEGSLARRLYLTPEGDVRGEIYYGAKGRSVTEIQRYRSEELRGRVGAYDSIIFPKKVTIISPETQKGSALFFTKVTALDTVDPLEFLLRVPPGTKEVFLEEKDPRYQDSKTFVTPKATPPPPEPASRTAHKPQTDNTYYASVERDAPVAPVPVPTPKKIPVYLAKPREVPEEKAAPLPEKKEKEIPKVPEPVVAPPLPAPAAADTVPAVNTPAPEKVPAPSEQPAVTNSQTTLDPSVEPSLDMGKQ